MVDDSRDVGEQPVLGNPIGRGEHGPGEHQFQREADALSEHLTRVEGGERARALDQVEMILQGDNLANLAGVLGRSENRPVDRLEATKAG